MRSAHLHALLVLATAFSLVGCLSLPGDGGGSDDTSIGVPSPDVTSPDTTDTDADTTSAAVDEFAISAIEPLEGRTAGGELVIIEGSQFVEGTEVWFGSARSEAVTVYSQAIIHARSPAHLPGPVTIKLTAPNGETIGFESVFIYRDTIAVHSLEPESADVAGGTPITVRGEGFTDETSILLGGRLLIDQALVDDSTILGIVPPGTAIGPVDVLAFTPWSNARSRDAFEYVARPRIDAVLPPSTSENTETEVLLVGRGLTADSAVTIGGLASVLALDEQGIWVRTPALPAGVVDVTVDTQWGTAQLTDAFTVLGPDPGQTELLNVFPATGPTVGGTQVTLIAHGLVDLADTVVTFGQTAATVQSVDPATGRVVVLAPAGQGTVAVTLSTSQGESTRTAAWTWVASPSLVSASPTSGPVSGGDTLTISGSGLDADDLEVLVGALPAQIIEQTADQLRVITPPGTPGPADIRVETPSASAALDGAYDYQPEDGIEFYAISPNYGAVAGNTLVHLYGAGFTPQTTVTFDGFNVSEVEFISSTEIRARAPKSPDPVTVNVSVKTALETRTLTDAYSYFDPYSPYGGAWGPPIDETVNVTVLDLYETSPIPQAFVMLWSDPETPHQGLTDGRGQITFSDVDIQGAQMVTAAKSQYTAFSVVWYDAENVTIHLIPYNPPSSGGGGGGGTGLPGGVLTGKVSGLGKYVIVPPQTCAWMADKGLVGSEGTPSCETCSTDAECGEGYQCTDVAGGGLHCLKNCNVEPSCPSGYVCSSGEAGVAACRPDPGERAAWCQPTTYDLWDTPTPTTPTPPFDDGARAWVKPNGTYQMDVSLEEMAVVCVGGVIRDPADRVGSFLPLIMGVRRNVQPVSAEVKPDMDVQLNIALTRDVPLRLDGAPLDYHDPYGNTLVPTTSRVRVAFDFGAEGYWTVMDETRIATDRFTLAHQPKSMTGDLEGVTYALLAEVKGGLNAESNTQAYRVEVLDTDRVFHLEDGTWKVVQGGIRRDIHSLWGTDAGNLWAVGADGLIAHQKNGSWLSQFSPVTTDLNGVWGTAENHVVAVGDGGTILEFDAVTWKTVASPTTSNLEAVWGTGPNNMFAVGQGIVLRRTSGGWSALPGGPGTTLRGVWGPDPSQLMAVGEDGKLWHYDGTWSSVDLGIAGGIKLNAISGTGPENVWIAGELGTLVQWDGTTAIAHDVPTTLDLNAVFASAAGDVLAVGDRGTLLRWDGAGFTVQTTPDYSGDLRGVWGFDAAEDGSIAAGTQVVNLGPMLSFPSIGEPTPQGLAGSTFTYHLDWTAKPSVAPTFNFVEMLAGAPTYAFPAWWTVVAADVQDVTFPNLLEIYSINPFPATALMMKVNRVLRPGASADNFDFWDTYDRSGWASWSSDAVFFSPEF